MGIGEILTKLQYYIVRPRMVWQVRVIRLPWLPFRAAGITIGHIILLRRDLEDRRLARVLAHEIRHVEQIEGMGFIKFYMMYLYFYLRDDYRNVLYEIDARWFADAFMDNEFPISEIK
jgi:hypothetical protein